MLRNKSNFLNGNLVINYNLIQANSEASRTLDEILHSLQEQLQLNLLQQGQLLQQRQDGNNPEQLQEQSRQLEGEQRSLMLQIQWIQQQLAIVRKKSIWRSLICGIYLFHFTG